MSLNVGIPCGMLMLALWSSPDRDREESLSEVILPAVSNWQKQALEQL
jgi:hypothetical protein